MIYQLKRYFLVFWTRKCKGCLLCRAKPQGRKGAKMQTYPLISCTKNKKM